MHLTKLHATGNDFLVLSWLEPDAGVQGILGVQAAALCDRRRGIGADGLIVVQPGADGADVRMLLFNADGQAAEMSGNGIRCLAEVAVRAGVGDGKRLVVDTAAGRRELELDVDAAGALVSATVDMGPVTLRPGDHPRRRPERVRPVRRVPRGRVPR